MEVVAVDILLVEVAAKEDEVVDLILMTLPE